ncbi:LysE family translocator [Tenacibaculum sp. M341]|uniref:LysE family translocator n=1 Tax=Tenacibaculum sp. M341 TaxID=2530339 RepID=UPI00104E854B|nr:LysE family translocator [Tenacibaculum sp. M341]TCI84647.1 LysE family translocator [Tenacibaculum sp. M341]
MFGIINFEAFILASLLLNLTPGADTMYILGRSISQGKKAGILSALGIASGALIHCLFAVLGLSILLAKSALAFQIVKYVGAFYLIYLGIKMLTSSSKASFDLTEKVSNVNFRKIYLSGILTNLLNPKVAFFFLAFIPQFINETYSNSPIPFLVLGLTFITTGTIWCLILAFFSSKLSEKIRANYRFKIWLDKITGSLFIVLGIKLALSKK